MLGINCIGFHEELININWINWVEIITLGDCRITCFQYNYGINQESVIQQDQVSLSKIIVNYPHRLSDD